MQINSCDLLPFFPISVCTAAPDCSEGLLTSFMSALRTSEALRGRLAWYRMAQLGLRVRNAPGRRYINKCDLPRCYCATSGGSRPQWPPGLPESGPLLSRRCGPIVAEVGWEGGSSWERRNTRRIYNRKNTRSDKTGAHNMTSSPLYQAASVSCSSPQLTDSTEPRRIGRGCYSRPLISLTRKGRGETRGLLVCITSLLRG